MSARCRVAIRFTTCLTRLLRYLRSPTAFRSEGSVSSSRAASNQTVPSSSVKNRSTRWYVACFGWAGLVGSFGSLYIARVSLCFVHS